MEEALTERGPQEIVPTDPAAVAAGEAAKARIQSAYVMAMRRPRKEEQARFRIHQACQRPAFAERVEYNKPVGNQKIKGPSIRFAELALREWGNIFTEATVLHEDATIRRVRVTVTDLETNASFSKDIQVTKTVERKNAKGREILGERLNTYDEKVFIVKATDDELNNKESALISKVLRNEGLRLIPSDITDEALEIAKKTMKDRTAKDPAAEKKKVLDGLAELHISPTAVAEYLDQDLDTMSPAQIEALRGIYRAIRDGETTWAQVIEVPLAEEIEEPQETGGEEGEETGKKPHIMSGVVDMNIVTAKLKDCNDAFKKKGFKTVLKVADVKGYGKVKFKKDSTKEYTGEETREIYSWLDTMLEINEYIPPADYEYQPDLIKG